MIKLLCSRGLTIAWIAGFVCAVAFSYYIANHPEPIPGELRFARWLQERPLATAARIGNDIAYSHVSVPIGLGLTLLSLVRKRLDFAWMFGIALVIRSTNGALKEAIERPRPTEVQLRITEQADGFSYTSGHTFGSALLLGAAIVCIWRLPLSRRFQFAGTMVLLLLIVDCGMARVYVGAHWPTDVGGAWLIAALWIGLLAKIADSRPLRFGPMGHL